MNEFDDLENTLAAELRRRSGDVVSTEGLAGRARQRARVVRRRRAVAVGAVTVVALAVAVPSALSLRDVPQTTPQPAGDTTTELVLDGLATGAAPSIGYLEGDTFHRTDGRSVPLPGNVHGVLELPNGFMARIADTAGFGVVDLDADGAVTASRLGAGPVLSPDGGLVAYYDQDESIVRAGQADGGGTGPGGRDVPADQRLEPVGFLDDYRLVSNVSTGTGESAGIRIDRFAPGADPAPLTPVWDLVRVSAVSASAGLLVGPTEIRDMGGCWAVFPVDSGEPLWETCTYSFTAFSPDGRYLVGTTDYPDGEGFPFAVVVDARTGEVLHTYEGTLVHDMVFEDDDHLLINVRIVDGDDRLSALLRCDVAGSCELAAPVVRVGQEESAYSLGLQRW